MSQAADDQLALTLTDWERLLDVGIDLTTSHSDCTAINALFGKRIVSLQPTVLVTSSTAVSRNLRRLGELRGRLVKIGIDNVTDSRLVEICEQLIHVKTASHPALTTCRMVQGVEKSELLRLKDLERWAATRLAVHFFFPDAKCALEKLDKVTAYQLCQLSPRTVDSDDLTFLKALELSARIRVGLSCAQHHLIDRIITSKIEALQKSKAITFSSTSPGESSSSPPDKAKNKNDDKTTESKEQAILLHSKLNELEATIRTLKCDQQVMAEDKRALTRERDNLALALKTIEEQKLDIQQGLSQEREAYSSLKSASQEQRDNYQTSQTEVLKIKEHLLEAQGDKKSLAMDFEKLKAEMSQLSTASDTSGNMATVLGELLGQFRGEQIRLEDAIKSISEKLEYAESAYTAVAMNANKLAAENAHMKAELAKSYENHAQATMTPSIRASGPDSAVQFLVAERARLERELAKANGTLGTIHSSLNSYPMVPLTSPNASDTAGKVESQTNRVLPQAEEPVRSWGFMNANGPVSEMKALNTTINTSKSNADTFSQAPNRDPKNYIGSTNSWSPDTATLAPSTAVDTGDWPFANPGRAPSPSGSVESEL